MSNDLTESLARMTEMLYRDVTYWTRQAIMLAKELDEEKLKSARMSALAFDSESEIRAIEREEVAREWDQRCAGSAQVWCPEDIAASIRAGGKK